MAKCKLIKMDLTDFGTFTHFTVDLSKDITNIIGLNASGKSTILNALKLSLQLNEKKIPVYKFVRKTPDDSVRKAIVDLYMLIDDSPVTVHSEFSKGTISGNGRKINRKVTLANGKTYENTRANTYLTDTLGKTNLSIMFAINPKDNFIKASESDNLEKIMEILSLDFSKEWEASKANLKLHGNDLQKAKDKLTTQTASITATETLEKKYVDELSKLKSEFGTMSEMYNHVDEQIAESEKLSKEAYHKMQTISSSMKEIQQKNAKAQDTQLRLDDFKTALKSYEEELNILSTKNKVKADLNAMREVLANVEQKKATDEKTYSSNRENLVGINVRIQTLNQKLAAVKGGLCPTCNQPTDKVTLEVEDQMKQLLEDQSKIQEILNNISTQLQTSNEIYQNTLTNIRNGEVVNDQVDKDTNRITVLNGLISNAKTQIEILESQIEEVISGTELEAQYKEQKAIYDDAEKSVHESQGMKMALANLGSQVTMAENTLNTTRDQIKNLKSGMPAIVNEIELKEAIVKEDQRMVYLCEMIPVVYLEKCKNDIMKISSAFVKPFGYEGVYLDLDIENKRLSYELIKDGLNMTYDLMSGFETDLVNLAIVGTLAHLLKVPSMCIDELDAHADETKADKIANLLLNISKNTQVLAITHDSDIVQHWSQKSSSLTIIKLSGGTVENDRE